MSSGNREISHSGLLARSPEGHAALGGMQIKGQEELWIEIQANTFRNWVNEHLHSSLMVDNLAEDFRTGVRLCSLVESLQKKPIKPSWNKRPINQHYYLENVTAALNAIERDGVKLVNIGNTDIVNGNLKLILGLIWSLIVRYQIGRSKFPPRKLMLTWLQFVLPELQIDNLTTDWNSGVALSALVDFCKPGAIPYWRSLDRNHAVENCKRAMNIAQKELNVPAILEPEYLASPWIDELSGMTYLSYFLKQNSPGYFAVLEWTNSILKRPVSNFTTDWNNGYSLCELVRHFGGSAPPPEKLNLTPDCWSDNIAEAIKAAAKLGVKPILSAHDMSERGVEHLAVMTYISQFMWISPQPPLHDRIKIKVDATAVRIGDNINFEIEMYDRNLEARNLRTEITGPDNRTYSVELHGDNLAARGCFRPRKLGMHKLVVYYDDQDVATHWFRSLPPLPMLKPPAMAPCPIGSLVEVLINATGAPNRHEIRVRAYSPSNRALECPLKFISGANSAIFKPDEPGEWIIEITYQGKPIQIGPYNCSVFDPDGVEVSNLDGAMPLVPHSVRVNTKMAGSAGEIVGDVVYGKRSIHCRTERVGLSGHEFNLHFTPIEPGKHRLYVYFNGYDIKNSPFILKIGRNREKKITNLPNIGTFRRSESPSLYAAANRASPIAKTLSSRNTTTASGSSSYDEIDADSGTYFDETVTNSRQRAKSTLIRETIGEEEVADERRRQRQGRVVDEDSGSRKETDRLMAENGFETVKTTKNIIRKTKYSREQRHENDDDDDNAKTGADTEHPKLLLPIYTKTIRESNSHIFERRSEERDRRSSASSPASNPFATSSSSESIRTFYEYSERYRNGNSGSDATTASDTDLENRTRKLRIDNDKTANARHDENARGPTNVNVKVPKRGHVMEPVEILINCGDSRRSREEADECPSTLEILIDNGQLTPHVNSLGCGLFSVGFRPPQPKQYRLDIRYNQLPVEGSPWFIDIMSGPQQQPKQQQQQQQTSQCSVLGEATRLIAANTVAVFEIITTSQISPDELNVQVVAPSKKIVPSKVTISGAGATAKSGRKGVFNVEFVPVEIGTHFIEISIAGEKLIASPLIAKVYNSGLITVSDIQSGHVGQPVQFKVDASQAGEGQLEISINEGEVPNHVQVVGGGRCLVSFTPEQPKPHFIDIKFNGEPVKGCPIMCKVAEAQHIVVNLEHLEFIAVQEKCQFRIGVLAGGGRSAGAGVNDKLAVCVRNGTKEVPVRVQGNSTNGFLCEFVPVSIGLHEISVELNDSLLNGMPFLAKAFDSQKIRIGSVANGTVNVPVTFTVDASDAGEGNLEITISSRGLNIPTQVHPQGSAKFAVSFVPLDAYDHIINVAFNKRIINGCPVKISVTNSSPAAAAAAAAIKATSPVANGHAATPIVTLPGPCQLHRPAALQITHRGKLDDLDVNVEGPGGQSIPAQVHHLDLNRFQAEFVPKHVGEHKIFVSVHGQVTENSPYAVKVYDVKAIKVKDAATGNVGKQVTFLVETSQAGPGNLEVTVNGGRVPTSAQAQGAHTYAISFTPREPILHCVDLKFNGQEVPGSPFRCSISPPAKILTAEVMDKIAVGDSCIFVVESPQTPTVEILGPQRRLLPVQIKPSTSDAVAGTKFEISFGPVDVGDHSVEVRLPGSGGHVDGSPFLIKAYDAQKVHVTDIADGVVGKPISFSINASQAGAGNLEIIVAVAGRNVPNFVQSEGNARFKVNFKPAEAAAHTISVRFNGRSVPGSPFLCTILPAKTQCRVAVSGSGIGLASIRRKAEIRTELVNGHEPEVIVTTPHGAIVECVKSVVDMNAVVYEFQPEIVGRYSVSVFVSDQHVFGSPFSCNVFDVTKVKLTGLPNYRKQALVNGGSGARKDLVQSTAEVGKPVTFSVDAAQAGEGTLELAVSTNHGTVKAEVMACARGLYDVTFVPSTSDDHFVNVTFNDEQIPGSPFPCSVIEHVQYLALGTSATVDLPTDNHYLEIVSPRNENVPFILKDLVAEFQLSDIGTYKVQVMLSHDKLAATKTIHVFDINGLSVGDNGALAADTFVHRPAVLKINTTKAGPGKLTAQIKVGAKLIPHSLKQNANRNEPWELVFHPTDIVVHKVYLFYNGVPRLTPVEIAVKPIVNNEPYACGLGLYQARLKEPVTFQIENHGKSARDFDVVISSENQKAYPVRCYQLKSSGRLQVEYVPEEVGLCKIEVFYLSQAIASSPFACQVFDPDAVIVHVPQIHSNLKESVVIKVNTQKSGVADLRVIVESPSGHLVPVHYTTLEANVTQVWFVATTVGLYQAKITYGNQPLKDSPWIIAVNSSGLNAPPRALGTGLEHAEVGEKATFSVSSIQPPRVQIESPSDGHLDSVVQCIRPGEYIISYVPLAIGAHTISIMVAGQKLAGCPFQVPVTDSSKITIRPTVNELISSQNCLRIPCQFTLDVSEAGPGELECFVGDRKARIERNDSLITVSIGVDGLGSGEHPFKCTFNGKHFVKLPSRAVTADNCPVTLTGKGLSDVVTCGELLTFRIDGSETQAGNPEIVLKHVDTHETVAVLLNMIGERVWTAQYKLTVSGLYTLTVQWSGKVLDGCPYRIEARPAAVNGPGTDASKVLCSGEGLKQGVVGKEIRAWIDTRRAGRGELTANCSGPSKVAYCELYDHNDATFTLNVKPQEAGRHTLTVKYGGSHVPGSPFSLKVAGAPEPNKVKVYGPGIEHGVLASFQSRFICDTRGAGAGQLTVRVKGPKNAFRVEMQRENQRDRMILCKFDPTEPGDYRVEIKWAAEHVPGSPFHVMIFDTQEELRRYLNAY